MKSLVWTMGRVAILSCAVFFGGHSLRAAAAEITEAASRVTAALDELDAWLGDGDNGDRWRAYLHADELRTELAKGSEADPGIVAGSLQWLYSDANGLDLAPFEKARQAIEAWQQELRGQYADDLPRLAWASRGDHTPISEPQFEAVRADLRSKARALESALAFDPQLATNWKTYLRWELLEPHLAGGFVPDARSLAELDEVLRRFRNNQLGLELPPFTNVAQAIVRYRALASWAVTAKVRDPRPIYERYLTDIQRLLERHLQRPTIETTRQVARLVGMVDGLGQSPELVGAVRTRFAQPNVYGMLSTGFVTRAPTRPVNEINPVRDCILGTSIFGSAHTVGAVHYQILDSTDSVQLAIHLEGTAYSRTRGYNGPVRINSSGRTAFWAFQHVTLTNDDFITSPAVADADTRTQIRSIQKTGGKFGHRLIERIAWKRAGQQKRQAERIASSHARVRVLNEFEENVVRDLAAARLRYETQVIAPLVRRGVTPEYLQMNSAAGGVFVETLFAGRSQLGAASLPPPMMPDHDLAVQVHESAVNNFLPLALAAARISQQSADVPPVLEGNVPNWLKLLSVTRPQLGAAVAAGADIVEEAQEEIAEAIDAPQPETPPFKPYSITLNAESPASVHFDDGHVVIRVRAASMASDERVHTNWDFVVTYKITHQDNRIVLVRVGEIEVFPTGFDPDWPTQLTAEQTSFRNVLKGNMNERANAGQSFPKEIPIEPVRLSQFGVLVLRELVADDGWLTVGWKLP